MKTIKAYGIVHNDKLVLASINYLKRDTYSYFMNTFLAVNINLNKFHLFPMNFLKKFNCKLVKLSVSYTDWK